jgi:hypothetical protein
MEPDEALLLKCYDSAPEGRARFTAQTVFDDPTSPPDAAPEHRDPGLHVLRPAVLGRL